MEAETRAASDSPCFATVAKVAIVGGIVAGIGVVIPQVMKAMADHNFQDTPKVSDLASAAIGGAVTWPEGVPGFTLASAQLNGALQLGLKAS